MTHLTQPTHLSHDELLKALVHGEDLPRALAEHLTACPACRTELKRLQHRFGKIGQLAANLAPQPTRRFHLPVEATAGPWRFKPLLAAGMAAAVVGVFAMYGPSRAPTPLQSPIVRAVPTSDLELTLVVDALVENALPPAYRELAQVADPTDASDWIDAVVPPFSDGAVSDEDDLM